MTSSSHLHSTALPPFHLHSTGLAPPQDALILAKSKGYDVFNALDILQNIDFLKDLKFGIGDGSLHYYLYNWRISTECTPQEVGFILL